MSMPPDMYNLAVPTTHIVYSDIVNSSIRKNARRATHTAYYPSQGRASLASSMGPRPGTQAGATANTKGHYRREFDLMLGFEDLKRDIRATSGTYPPLAQGTAQQGCSGVLGRCACYFSCEIVDLMDLLKGAAKLQSFGLAICRLTLVDSRVEAFSKGR